MSSAAYEIGAWFKSDPSQPRPDLQMLAAPYSFNLANRTELEPFPGMNVVIYPLRPTSRGSIHIETRDPAAPAVFQPNYRSTEADRKAMVAALKRARDWAEQPALKALIVEETMPGPELSERRRDSGRLRPSWDLRLPRGRQLSHGQGTRPRWLIPS